MHATLKDVGKRVRIITKVTVPKPDRSEKPGDPVFAFVGRLTGIDADGTHWLDQGVGKPLASSPKVIDRVQILR